MSTFSVKIVRKLGSQARMFFLIPILKQNLTPEKKLYDICFMNQFFESNQSKIESKYIDLQWTYKHSVMLAPGHNSNIFKIDILSPYVITPIYEDPEKHIVLT